MTLTLLETREKHALIGQAAVRHKQPYARPRGGKQKTFCHQEMGCFCQVCKQSVGISLLVLKVVLGKLLYREALEAAGTLCIRLPRVTGICPSVYSVNNTWITGKNIL